MRNRIRKCCLLTSVGFMFLFGCASTHAPRGWLSQPDEVRTDVYGGWIKITHKTESGQKLLFFGELIAISNDSVYAASQQLFVFAQSDILSARLTKYNANAANMGALVTLGTLSTISNGFYLVFTAPLWILGGSIATGHRSREPILDYPAVELESFVPYCRYPQGMPTGIDRSKIKMKAPKSANRKRR